MCALYLWMLLFASSLYSQQESGPSSIVDSNNRLAFEVFKNIAKQEDNTVISPLGLSTVLGMAYSGSAGYTEVEMSRILHYELSQSQIAVAWGAFLDTLNARFAGSAVSFNSYNSIWVQQGQPLKEDFERTIKDVFKASLMQVNFIRSSSAARLAMNNWAAMRTHGKIRTLMQPSDVTANERMCLINVLYLQAPWASAFENRETKTLPFFVHPNKAVSTSIMHKSGQFAFFEGKDYYLLELPYQSKKADELSMLIILPATTYGFPHLKNTFNESELKNGLLQLKMQLVEIFLPRFKFSSTISFKEALQSLGMELPFTDKADFSKMTGVRNLKISKIWQKAFISVDEKGTEASAGTVATMGLKAVLDRSKPKVFNANHPFLFAIIDKKTSAILFLGEFLQPSSP